MCPRLFTLRGNVGFVAWAVLLTLKLSQATPDLSWQIVFLPIWAPNLLYVPQFDLKLSPPELLEFPRSNVTVNEFELACAVVAVVAVVCVGMCSGTTVR